MFPIVSVPAILSVLPDTRAYNSPVLLHRNCPWLSPDASGFPFPENGRYSVPDYPLTGKCHIYPYFHTKAVLPCWNHSLIILPASWEVSVHSASPLFLFRTFHHALKSVFYQLQYSRNHPYAKDTQASHGQIVPMPSPASAEAFHSMYSHTPAFQIFRPCYPAVRRSLPVHLSLQVPQPDCPLSPVHRYVLQAPLFSPHYPAYKHNLQSDFFHHRKKQAVHVPPG